MAKNLQLWRNDDGASTVVDPNVLGGARKTRATYLGFRYWKPYRPETETAKAATETSA